MLVLLAKFISMLGCPGRIILEKEGVNTFHRLLRKEIMHNRLNTPLRLPIHNPRLLNNIPQILQHKPSLHTRPLPPTLRKIMSNPAPHVHKQHIVSLDTPRQLRHRIKPNIHPAWPSLVIRRHVVIELLCVRGVRLQIFEEVRGRLVPVLEGRSVPVAGVDIVCAFEVCGEGG
jgi:hypothetical protein